MFKFEARSDVPPTQVFVVSFGTTDETDQQPLLYYKKHGRIALATTAMGKGNLSIPVLVVHLFQRKEESFS